MHTAPCPQQVDGGAERVDPTLSPRPSLLIHTFCCCDYVKGVVSLFRRQPFERQLQFKRRVFGTAHLTSAIQNIALREVAVPYPRRAAFVKSVDQFGQFSQCRTQERITRRPRRPSHAVYDRPMNQRNGTKTCDVRDAERRWTSGSGEA